MVKERELSNRRPRLRRLNDSDADGSEVVGRVAAAQTALDLAHLIRETRCLRELEHTATGGLRTAPRCFALPAFTRHKVYEGSAQPNAKETTTQKAN